MFDVFAVLEDLNLLQSNESARHHFIEDRQKRFDLFLGVDDLDDERPEPPRGEDSSSHEVGLNVRNPLAREEPRRPPELG